MSKQNASASASGGIGFVGLLTIVFIVLKLCKVITWSWLLVLSPMLLSIGFALFAIIVAIIMATRS